VYTLHVMPNVLFCEIQLLPIVVNF